MLNPKGRKDFPSFLYCSSVLEEKTHVLYKRLAKKSEIPLVKSLLLHIAYDSQKLAILNGIRSSIAESDVKTNNCDKKMGETWGMIHALLQEASEKKMSSEELSSFMSKLEVLESTIGEEYYMLCKSSASIHDQGDT